MLKLNIEQSDEVMDIAVVDVDRDNTGRLVFDILVPSESIMTQKRMAELIFMEMSDILNDIADDLRKG